MADVKFNKQSLKTIATMIEQGFSNTDYTINSLGNPSIIYHKDEEIDEIAELTYSDITLQFNSKEITTTLSVTVDGDISSETQYITSLSGTLTVGDETLKIYAYYKSIEYTTS